MKTHTGLDGDALLLTDHSWQIPFNQGFKDLHRKGLKNARISFTSASGCSNAAKWPPFGITVQRLMSVYMRSATERGGRRISFGNSA